MKATIDIPDEIYRRVKAKSALEGRAIREVTVELFRSYLTEEAHAGARGSAVPPAAPGSETDSVPPWLGLAREHIRKPRASHRWEEIRASLERGWGEDVAEPRARPRRRGRR
ncbi:MAG: ParG [Acidobacteria bacterium]|nr:ParG [Acidobacteriota bacterium]